jgi:hypothetical protein
MTKRIADRNAEKMAMTIASYKHLRNNLIISLRASHRDPAEIDSYVDGMLRGVKHTMNKLEQERNHGIW